MTDAGWQGGCVAGILLAGGAGRRMGGAKALVDLAGQPLVIRAARVLVDGGCDRVVVVVGAQGDEVMPIVHEAVSNGALSPIVTCVTNDQWLTGMGSSLLCGLEAVTDGETECAVIHLVDLPDVTAGAIARLIAARSRSAGTDTLAWAATYAGVPRNPVLFDRLAFAGLRSTTTGDRGARAWLRRHADRVEHVACDDVGDPADLDTPEQVDRWLATRAAAPTGEHRGT